MSNLEFWSQWFRVRFMEGLGLTLGLTILIPFLWRSMPAWLKVFTYLCTVATFFLIYVGTVRTLWVMKNPIMDPFVTAEGYGLLLLIGPVIGLALRRFFIGWP